MVYYISWWFFWVIHPAIFLPAALLFPFMFFKWGWVIDAYYIMLSFDWFAIPVVYPVIAAMFLFSTSPYFIKSDLDRAQEAFGIKKED